VVMTIMMVVVVAYTVLGGMFSVVVTDFFQFVVLAFGMLVATVAVLMTTPPAVMSAAVAQHLGANGTDPLANPRFGWAFIIWIFVSSIAAAALWQPGVSKALSSESPEVARKVFFYTGLTFAGRAMIPMLWGVAALAYFGPGQQTLGVMPRLLGEIVPTGFLGLLVAGMLAASMSTYSAYMLAWSAVFARDVAGGIRPDLTEKDTIRLTRYATGGIATFLMIFGLWYQIPDTAFQYLYISGAMYTAGALALVAAGLYWPRATARGAYAALLCGAAAPLGFLLLERARDRLPASIGFVTDVNVAGLLSFILAAAGMVVGSLATRRVPAPTPAANRSLW
jgi:SSS family solute:Na+ symporter